MSLGRCNRCPAVARNVSADVAVGPPTSAEPLPHAGGHVSVHVAWMDHPFRAVTYLVAHLQVPFSAKKHLLNGGAG